MMSSRSFLKGVGGAMALASIGMLGAPRVGAQAMTADSAAANPNATSSAMSKVTVDAASPGGLGDKATIPALTFTHTPMGQIAARLSRLSGAQVVADAGLDTFPVDFTTYGGSLDAVLTQLAQRAPSVSVRALLLPASPDAANPVPFTSRAVGAYVAATDALSTTPATPASGTTTKTALPAPSSLPHPAPQFEALGRKIDRTQALSLCAQLHLQPVYLLHLDRPLADPIAKMAALQAETLREWQDMTPDQRKQAAKDQFDEMMNMDAGARQAMLGQMMQAGAAMMQQIQSMTPEQQQEFQQEIATAMKDSGMTPPTGRGGGGKGGNGGNGAP